MLRKWSKKLCATSLNPFFGGPFLNVIRFNVSDLWSCDYNATRANGLSKTRATENNRSVRGCNVTVVMGHGRQGVGQHAPPVGR